MGPHEIANLTGSCSQTLTSIVLIVVGLVFARPANASAGYVVGAAGGIGLLAACCTGAFNAPQVAVQLGPAVRGTFCVFSLAEAAVWGLVAYGAVLLARDAAARVAGRAS